MSEQQKPANSATASKSEATVKLRPTLFIGVGGTGMEVLMRVRRRILNAAWGSDGVRLDGLTQFPIAQFIHFDLDHGAVIDSGRAQAEDLQYQLVKFSDDEKLIEKFDIEKYSRDDASLSRYPHIQSWLPLTPRKIRELGIDPAKGAGQIRAVSRLYFFDKYPKVRDKIRSKLSSLKAGLSQEDILKKLNLELDTSKFRIVVLGSVAGGTGSGAFLDMGWLAKWVASNTVDNVDVELMLFMPTGYSGANKSRTEANAYAALMELESTMLGGSGYVDKWDEYDRVTLASKPYDEVHIVDSGNLAGQHTNQMEDVYSMVADALFEDFTSADFANRKRSVAVNQRQHKILPFSPPVPTGRFGDMKLTYACSYSAFGQSVLDTQGTVRSGERAYSLAAEMLKAFFGVAGHNPTANRATEKQRDAFMMDYMSLRMEPFTSLPEFSPATVKSADIKSLQAEFMDFALVDLLLKGGQGGVEVDISEETRQRVNDKINEISGVDREQWPTQIREAMKQLLRDVMRNPDARAETAEDRIVHRRRDLFSALCRDIGDQLYLYLDNKEQGGFEYVLSLVEQIKDRLENATSGVCTTLKKSSEHYSRIKDALLTYEYERQLKNLEETSGGGFLGLFKGGNETQARDVLEHLKTDIANILAFHLRSKAAAEAAVLMTEISAWLGKNIGVDPQGVVIWDGVMGDFHAGQEAVLDMMKRLERDRDIIRQQIRSKHATLQVIESGESNAQMPDARTLREWADEAFQDLGGSRELFRSLTDPDQQSPLLLKVIRMAERRMPAMDLTAGQAQEPLIAALERMSLGERQKVFAKLLQCSMPWIDAKLGGDFAAQPDRFKCFVGVPGAPEFTKKFRNELVSAIPAGIGLNSEQLAIVETGMPGRAVCYTELSGFPLTIMRGMETWRASYRVESEKTPLHTHIDSTRFRHPLVPSPQELNELADHFKYFLQAVMLGVIKRTALKGISPPGQYEFEVAPGDIRRIGNERGFRLNGLPVNYRDKIIERVNDQIDELSAESCAMLAALAEYYASAVYSPRMVADEMGVEQPRVGFASAMAKETARELTERAISKGASESQIKRSLDLIWPGELEKWATKIMDSEKDAYPWEVREPIADRQKWILNREVVHLHAQLLASVPATPSRPTAPPVPVPPPLTPMPPVLPQYQYHVALGGQQYGPYLGAQIQQMLRDGSINQTALVWREGLPGWVPLSQCPELAMPGGGGMPPPLPPALP